jgi:hypothetical protein
MEDSSMNPNLSRAQSRTSLAAFNWSVGLRSFYDTTCGGGLFIFVSFALSLAWPRSASG